MNGNQGLEALAALCGGEAAAVANASNTNSSNNRDAGQSPATGSQPAPAAGSAQATPGSGITQQQWQQAVAAAAALGGNTAAGTPNSVSSAVSALFGNPKPAPSTSISDPLVAMQQLAYYRYIQDQATAAAQKVVQIARDGQSNVHPFVRNNPAVALALAGQQAQHQLQQQLGPDGTRQQVLPPAAAPSPSAAQPETSSAARSMPPPPNAQGSSSLPSTLSTAGIASSATPIAPQPGVRADQPGSMSEGSGSGEFVQDKKLQKRAANRRSAQLSRKRKKVFIEELKDENDELRRKEQILRSIPDLIVVFDSTGKLWFVSQSVNRFLNMSAKELEGTSFWDRLCEDSVRLLKAAFMDSLAARRDDSDSAPLGSGVWELRLVDKDGSFKVVTLNGVVHFSGDRPECVCSIRPNEQAPVEQQKSTAAVTATSATTATTKKSAQSASGTSANAASDGSSEEPASKAAKKSSIHYRPLIRAKPQQSVISSGSSAGECSASSVGLAKQKVPRGKRREAARISDGDSVSADSGSSDELGE